MPGDIDEDERAPEGVDSDLYETFEEYQADYYPDDSQEAFLPAGPEERVRQTRDICSASVFRIEEIKKFIPCQ
jgi:hypothetical protein